MRLIEAFNQFKAEPDPKAARVIKSEGYARCEGLEDRLDFPSLEKLAPSFREASQ